MVDITCYISHMKTNTGANEMTTQINQSLTLVAEILSNTELESDGYFDAYIGLMPQRPEAAYIKGWERYHMERYGAPF